VARRALGVLTGWAFDTFGHEGLERLGLLHQVDDLASCRVAEKCGYALDRVLPGAPRPSRSTVTSMCVTGREHRVPPRR
jgi:RimJ/RimL family protein N-acetyltransferase